MKIKIVLKQSFVEDIYFGFEILTFVEDIYFGFEILSNIRLVFIPYDKFRKMLNKKHHKRLIKYEN